MEITGASTLVTRKVLQEVADERARQDAKWGEQNHPDGTTAELTAHAEHAREVCDEATRKHQLTYFQILNEEFYEVAAEEDPIKLRTELLQVAGVAVAWVESIDRRLKKAEDAKTR